MSMKYEELEAIVEEYGTLFKNKEVFTNDYLPETYNFRNNQLKAMRVYFKDIEDYLAPEHMLLYGSYATGKTSTTLTFLQSAEKEYDNLIYVHINCRINKTEHSILSAIYKSIFKGSKVKSGLSTVTLFNKIMNYIVDNEKVLVMALDDFVLIKNRVELNNLFFKLLRANEAYPGAKVSIIAITNYGGKVELDKNVETVFSPVEINFPQYTHSEMYTILKQRCKLGFIKGVLGHEALELVTNHAYDIGDLREGIRLLSQGGKNAEIMGNVFITPECIFRVVE